MQEKEETTPYRRTLKNKVLDVAIKLFIVHGVRAVKMDDIAQELGISKRTLYEIYTDKEELLYQSVCRYDRQKQEHLSQYARQHHVVDIIMEAYQLKTKELKRINPVFFTDVLRYPKVEAYIKTERERTRVAFRQFMSRGVEEGLFQQQINYDIITQLFDAIGNHIMCNKLLQTFSIEQLFVNMFLVPLRGLCTAKGQTLMDVEIAKILQTTGASVP
jgi:AcrR family transcriptional regulator